MIRLFFALLLLQVAAAPAVAQTEAPNGTAPTATEIEDAPSSSSTAALTSPTISSTPSGTATPATEMADSPDSASTEVVPSGEGYHLHDPNTCVRISNVTSVCAGSIEDGIVSLTIHAERATTAQLLNAGSLANGGEYQSQPLFLKEGRQTVTMRVGETDSVTVALIDGGEGRGIPISKPTELIGGPFTARDAQLVGFVAAFTVAGVILVQAARWKLSRGPEPERIA